MTYDIYTQFHVISVQMAVVSTEELWSMLKANKILKARYESQDIIINSDYGDNIMAIVEIKEA